MKNERNENKLNAAVELPDESAEKVSGGGWWNSDNNYASGDTPVFHVGQTVYSNANWYYTVWKDCCRVYYYRGVVKEVSSDKSGLINTEFTYTVDWDGKYICGVNYSGTVLPGYVEAYSKHETGVYESYLTSVLGSKEVK